MARLTFFIVSVFVLLGLSACNSKPQEHRETLLIFGTLVDITLYDVDDETAARAITALKNDFDKMHEMWHPWKPGALGRTNELLALGGTFSVNPSVLPLIKKSQQLAATSHNLYNPAIGRLLDIWGFHNDDGPQGPAPSADAIAALIKSNPQISDIEVNGIRLTCRNPAVKLDFSAMAKGYAVDLGIDLLSSMGIENAIINAGGDLKVIGRHGERPWHIGVRHPRRTGVVAAIDVYDGESVFTSGDYERYFEDSKTAKRYHHILDPRTGYPADKSISVTVIHPDAATADAAATALFVAGPDEWYAIARDMKLKYVMLIDKQNVIHMNPAMAKRVQFETRPDNIKLSPEL
ncbi:FAD:protein FMN transferase [Kaarinaea lacus]